MFKRSTTLLLLSLFAGGILSPLRAMSSPPVRFTSVYTNLKTACRPAFKLQRGEEPPDDVPLRCRGYGGYEVRIDFSATSSSLRIDRAGRPKEDSIPLAVQPLFYDREHRIEWRLANGKPFAVILRVVKSRSDTPEEMWRPENKSGEALIVKGVAGFEHINLEVDAQTPGANLKARQMADAAYSRQP